MPALPILTPKLLHTSLATSEQFLDLLQTFHTEDFFVPADDIDGNKLIGGVPGGPHLDHITAPRAVLSGVSTLRIPGIDDDGVPIR
jgi:hypothetical protein